MRQARETARLSTKSLMGTLFAPAPREAPRTWILFVNNDWVRIFRCGEKGLALACEFTHPLSGGRQRDPLFLLRGVSLRLEECVRQDLFDELIVAAPPRTLKALRLAFSPAVLSRMVSGMAWPAVVARDKENAA